MAILRERKVWRRPRRAKAFQLTDAERVNVQAALRVATSVYGSLGALQRKMGVSHEPLAPSASHEDPRYMPPHGLAQSPASSVTGDNLRSVLGALEHPPATPDVVATAVAAAGALYGACRAAIDIAAQNHPLLNAGLLTASLLAIVALVWRHRSLLRRHDQANEHAKSVIRRTLVRVELMEENDDLKNSLIAMENERLRIEISNKKTELQKLRIAPAKRDAARHGSSNPATTVF